MIVFVVDRDNQLREAIAKARDQVSDLTIPLTLIIASWFKSNRAFLALKGPGKFVDLRPGTKSQKLRKHGSVYPVLVASGKMMESVTNPDAPGAVGKVLNKTVATVGTMVKSKKGAPYPTYIQLGTKRMVARPFVMIGAEQTGPDEFNQRREAWIKIIGDYVVKASGGFASGAQTS